MKVVYIALDPLKYARIKKIAYSIKRCTSVEFDVMVPKVRFVWRGGIIGRLLVGAVNYLTILLQIMFVESDIFWVANSPDILALPLVLRRKRYVLEYRSPWSLQIMQEFGAGPWARLSAFIEDIALRHAEVITLTTSKLVTRVKRYGKPVLVIPNYPSKAFRVTITRKEFRKKHSVGEDQKVILFVGRLSRVEGADMLCDIATKVFERINALFWIVGDGPLYPLLEVCRKKFLNRVRLFGWQSNEEIPNFINAADVCIVPRHHVPYSGFYNEEGVTKISEYMFFGKPIVACGVAESEQYLLVNENQMDEGIIKAINNPVGVPSRKTWEDHSEKKIGELFQLLIQRRDIR